MSKINEEAKKKRHDKFYSIYAAKPKTGKLKNSISQARRYLSTYSPVRIGPDAAGVHVETERPLHSYRKFAKKMSIMVLAFFLVTSFDIGRASMDAGAGWQLDFEENNLALNSNMGIIADQEGYLMKSMPLSGEAAYAVDRGENVTYLVQSGDTLSVIAYRFGLNQNTLLAVNDLSNANYLKSDQELIIPQQDGAYIEVESGDTLESLVEDFGGDLALTKEINEIGNDYVIQEGEELFIVGEDVAINYLDSIAPVYVADTTTYTYTSDYNASDVGTSYINTQVVTAYASADFVYPTVGSLTQGYYSGHYAYDIADVSKPAIVAISDGTVVTAAYGWNGGYGNYVIIDHGNGYKSLYAHLEEIYTWEGAYVSMGEAIGKMGNSGRVYGATGIHLHFEVSYNGVKFPACDVGICY